MGNERRIESVFDVKEVFVGKMMTFFPPCATEKKEVKINEVYVIGEGELVFESEDSWIGYSHSKKKFSIIEKWSDDKLGRVITMVMIDGVFFEDILDSAVASCK